MNKQLTIIKRGDKFFNAQHNTFSNKIHLSSWYKSENEAAKVAKHFALGDDYQIDKIDAEEFYNAGADSTTRTIIACEVARSYIEESLDIIPAVTMDAKHLRNALRNATEKLKVIAPHIDDITVEKENEAYMCLGIFDQYVRTVSSIDIVNMEEVSFIIEAYKKNPKSLTGITKKVLK